VLAHRIWQYFSLHDRTIIGGAKYARAVNLMVAIPTGYYPTNWFWPLSKIIKFEVQNSLLRAIYSMVYSTVECIRISSNLCFRTTILYNLLSLPNLGRELTNVTLRHSHVWVSIWLIPINALSMASFSMPPAHQARSCCTLRCAVSLKNRYFWWTQGRNLDYLYYELSQIEQ